MISLDSCSKRYGDRLAVDDLSFVVRPGRVTGFLGPNGSGKSTAMRMILGLDAPTAGRALVDGRPYAELALPLTKVGALLEAHGAHPCRSAVGHLRALAATHGIGRRRVTEVLEDVGLADVARKRVGWIRGLLRDLAGEGRTVFLSSHLMSELAATADHVVVIGRGRLIADDPVDVLVKGQSREVIRIRSPDASQLRRLLAGPGASVRSLGSDLLEVEGVSAQVVGDLAAAEGLALYEMTPQRASLEDVFLSLTRDAVEFDSKEGGR